MTRKHYWLGALLSGAAAYGFYAVDTDTMDNMARAIGASTLQPWWLYAVAFTALAALLVWAACHRVRSPEQKKRDRGYLRYCCAACGQPGERGDPLILDGGCRLHRSHTARG